MSEDTSKQDRQTRAIQLLLMMDGAEGSALARSRVDAWNYYLQRPRGDEVKGRSPVVSGDVSAMVESTLSQVTEAFATDRLAEFEGISQQDEFQAQLEGAVVSSLIMSGRGWYRMAAAVKNGLLLRMSVMRASVCTTEQTNIQAYENVDTLAKIALEATGVKFSDYDAEARTAKVQVKQTTQALDVVSVNPENFLFVQWPLDDFENIPACAERFVSTRKSLIDDEGLDPATVDALTATVVPWKSDDQAHRQTSSMLTTMAVSARQQFIEWFKLYYLFDGQRYCAVVAGNKVLTEEIVSNRPPYAIGVAFINPGRLDGFSLYDKLKSTQDQGTALTRMLNDNSNAVTMNRLAVLEGAVNNDQLTDQDPSGVMQVRRSVAGGNVNNAVMAIQSMDLTQGIVTALTYNRGVRSEMGGASLDVGTGKVQLPDRMGSMGLDRAYSASEQLSSLVLKTFSQTLIKDLWLLVHELLRTEWNGPLPIKVEGRWLNPEPAKWPRRKGVVVKPGMSPGERQRRSLALGNVIALQTQLAGAGMEDVLIDAERYYRAVCDWARLNDISRPEQYLIDPTSEGAQKALLQKAQAKKQAAQSAAQLQQMAVALEQMGIAVNKYGIDVKAAVDKYKADLQSEGQEAELTIGLVQEREKADRELAAKAPAAEPTEPGDDSDAD